MLKCEIIGNLGADAQVKGENGKQFISFNVAHTDKWTDEAGTVHEQTLWVSCIINDVNSKVLPYLLKGKTVYVRGDARLRVFSSAKERRMVAGMTVHDREIELLGGSSDEVPKQLVTFDGVLVPTYKAYYIDPKMPKKPTELFDKNMQKFAVDKKGFITKIAEETSTNETVNS